MYFMAAILKFQNGGHAGISGYVANVFLVPENIGLAYFKKFLGWLEAEIRPNMYFMAAILKFQNGGHVGISANVNIVFRIPHAKTFPKMHRFANLPWFWTKKHSEPD